jgi:murein DD-endopeptidase MepM/ murein hydrolase activator NlpD
MIGFLRLAGVVAAASFVWLVGAAQDSSSEKLALNAIVPGAVMTQPFGCSTLLLEPFDPACPSHHFHTGVDLAAPLGTPVRAAAGGMASVAFDPGGAGLYVVVDVSSHVRVLYCHLSVASISSVSSVAGVERVVAGQVIGEVGMTGMATGPHLHFEVQVDGRPVDPVAWLAS